MFPIFNFLLVLLLICGVWQRCAQRSKVSFEHMLTNVFSYEVNETFFQFESRHESPIATWTRKPVPRPRAAIEGLATKIRCDYTCLLLQMREAHATNAAPSPLATEINVWYELFVLVLLSFGDANIFPFKYCIRIRPKIEVLSTRVEAAKELSTKMSFPNDPRVFISCFRKSRKY